MKIEQMQVADLIPYERNAKKHDDRQVANVAKSIEEFGMVQPIVVDKENNIIIGHCRALACKKAGVNEVPVVRMEDLTPEEANKLRFLDNKLNESEWDFEALKLDGFADIDFDGFDLNFDFESLDTGGGIEVEEDEAPPVPDEPVSKVGDLYILGDHRLICGDSTDPETIKKLMDGQKANLFLTDPPYNVDYTDGHEEERKIMNDHFDTDEECGEKLWLPAFTVAREFCDDCCSVYCFMPQGGTHMMMMMMMMRAGWQVKHELIWKKQSIVLNRADYNYQHEPFLYGWNKTHKFYGKGKFKNTSVWEFDRPTKSKEHPTMKPIELLSEILFNATQKGDIVLDSFGGSGSTLIACEQTGRKCCTCELDPHYADVIVQRWENLTGGKAERR
jgi:site-specific DNA-methyltransferase (adenine-specific)